MTFRHLEQCRRTKRKAVTQGTLDYQMERAAFSLRSACAAFTTTVIPGPSASEEPGIHNPCAGGMDSGLAAVAAIRNDAFVG